MSTEFIRMKSALEIVNTAEEMVSLLNTVRVVHKNIYLPDTDETVAYKELLNRVLEIINKTFEGKDRLTLTEEQQVRLIGVQVQKLSSQFEHPCWEEAVGFFGEYFCCSDYACGFVVCKEMVIYRYVGKLDG